MFGKPNMVLIALGFLAMLLGMKLIWSAYLSTGTSTLIWFPIAVGYGFGVILFAVVSEPFLTPAFGTSNATAIQHVTCWIGLLSLLLIAQYRAIR